MVWMYVKNVKYIYNTNKGRIPGYHYNEQLVPDPEQNDLGPPYCT